MTWTILTSKESISTTSIPVFIMERHQAGQDKELMEVIEMTNNSKAVHQPRRSTVGHSGCFKCVVTLAVMGLIIGAMVAGFILCFLMFTTSCNQDAPPAKVQKLCNLTKINEEGRYDIFTVEKGATYVISGWVEFLKAPDEELILAMQMRKGEDTRTLQKKGENQTEIFFGKKVKLATGAIISISFQSAYVNSKFLVYEL